MRRPLFDNERWIKGVSGEIINNLLKLYTFIWKCKLQDKKNRKGETCNNYINNSN